MLSEDGNCWRTVSNVPRTALGATPVTSARVALISSKVRRPTDGTSALPPGRGRVPGTGSTRTFASLPSRSKVRKNSSSSGPFCLAMTVPSRDSGCPSPGS